MSLDDLGGAEEGRREREWSNKENVNVQSEDCLFVCSWLNIVSTIESGRVRRSSFSERKGHFLGLWL